MLNRIWATFFHRFPTKTPKLSVCFAIRDGCLRTLVADGREGDAISLLSSAGLEQVEKDVGRGVIGWGRFAFIRFSNVSRLSSTASFPTRFSGVSISVFYEMNNAIATCGSRLPSAILTDNIVDKLYNIWIWYFCIVNAYSANAIPPYRVWRKAMPVIEQ